MYKKILVPLDGSALAERAINHASDIARGTGAELILLQVVQVPMAKVPEAGQKEEETSIREVAAGAKAYLDGIAARGIQEGVKARTVILEGAAVGAILGFAHDEDVDLIVMSTHGRTGFSKALLGSVAEEVMLTTKRPVLLVKPERIPLAHHVDEAETFLSAH